MTVGSDFQNTWEVWICIKNEYSQKKNNKNKKIKNEYSPLMWVLLLHYSIEIYTIEEYFSHVKET